MLLNNQYHDDIVIIGFGLGKQFSKTLGFSPAAGRLGSVTVDQIFAEQWNRQNLAPTAAF